jgi:hypothetical protein
LATFEQTLDELQVKVQKVHRNESEPSRDPNNPEEMRSGDRS